MWILLKIGSHAKKGGYLTRNARLSTGHADPEYMFPCPNVGHANNFLIHSGFFSTFF